MWFTQTPHHWRSTFTWWQNILTVFNNDFFILRCFWTLQLQHLSALLKDNSETMTACFMLGLRVFGCVFVNVCLQVTFEAWKHTTTRKICVEYIFWSLKTFRCVFCNELTLLFIHLSQSRTSTDAMMEGNMLNYYLCAYVSQALHEAKLVMCCFTNKQLTGELYILETWLAILNKKWLTESAKIKNSLT